MISASIKDGADIVDVLLRRGADVNQKSKIMFLLLLPFCIFHVMNMSRVKQTSI